MTGPPSPRSQMKKSGRYPPMRPLANRQDARSIANLSNVCNESKLAVWAEVKNAAELSKASFK